eukprot:scaffold523878_cov15-Prasinocladus_malaysianus.AAC.1
MSRELEATITTRRVVQFSCSPARGHMSAVRTNAAASRRRMVSYEYSYEFHSTPARGASHVHHQHVGCTSTTTIRLSEATADRIETRTSTIIHRNDLGTGTSRYYSVLCSRMVSVPDRSVARRTKL